MRIAGQQQQPLPLKPWLLMATVFLIADCRHATATPNYCARFEFPELPGRNLTLPEGSFVNVSFQLVFDAPATPHTLNNNNNNNNNNNKVADDDGYAQCLQRDTIVIGVSIDTDMCRIRLRGDGDCESFTEYFCNCSRGGDTVGEEGAGGGGGGRRVRLALQLRHKLGLRDGGRWEWWTRDDMAPPVPVFVRVSEKSPYDKDAERPQTPHMVTASLPAGSLLSRIIYFSKDNPELVHDNNNNNNNATTTATILINNENTSTVRNDNDNNNDNNNNNNNERAGEMKERATANASVNVSYVGAVVAGVNVFTVVVIGIVIVFARRFCLRKRRLGRHCPPPRPCSMKSVSSERKSHVGTSVEYSGTMDKRLSSSSWLYDEIPDDIQTLISTDTSLYLHPVEFTTPNTATTPTPTPTTATAISATTSTTLTFSK